eukprot:1625081-Prymnesium_polylepis.2
MVSDFTSQLSTTFAAQSRQILNVRFGPVGAYVPTASVRSREGNVNCSERRPKRPLYSALTPPVHVP